MRVAVIGSGIAGNGAAYRLSQHLGSENVVQFEREARPGGHSATVDIEYDGARIAVDTGFIVYNTLNYPLLTALFKALDVPSKASDMGFSLSLDGGAFEWSGQDRKPLAALFAQKTNLISPRFWGMLWEILRFNARARQNLAAGTLTGLTLGQFLDSLGASAHFRAHYVLPMGAAIWSMPPSAVLGFPAESFIAFFDNHRLLSFARPVWRTVEGGSRVYVEKMLRASGHALLLQHTVRTVARQPSGVQLGFERGPEKILDHAMFDAVILATHSDTSLEMLQDADREERTSLAGLRYAENDVFLHRDPALMPRRRAAWAAWNVLGGRHMPGAHADADRPVCVSYWMNALQGIDPARPLFVTLNPPHPPKADLTFARFCYAHPQYDAAALATQRAMPALQGRRGVYYAGAWLGHGFHEDGLASGYAAADCLLADHGH